MGLNRDMPNHNINVLIIDPWGVEGPAKYLNGLVYGVSQYANVTLATNYYFKKTTNATVKVLRCFFKKSEKMPEGVSRKFVRGFEYIKAYREIISIVKKSKYDVVHINWLLMYKIDIIFLREIHKYVDEIVYTAHNIIPHINGENKIDELRKIYSECDKIIVHGNNLKEQFGKYFPDLIYKIYVQHHGADISPKIAFNIKNVDQHLINKCESFGKVFLYNGEIYRDKGADRLLSIWKDVPDNALLVVAGKIDEQYKELTDSLQQLHNKNNIVFIGQYISNDTLNYLGCACDLFVIPYRNASMSGVVFTAADFCKTVLTTDVGSLSEYLINKKNAFVVKNSDWELKNMILKIIHEYEREDLRLMGERLHSYINDNFSWEKIGKKIVEECY